MLKIPAIDLVNGECVRLYKGNFNEKMTYASDPVGQALKFQSAGFRRLHVVDLEGARAGSGQNRKAIQRILEASRVPVQVGGGIRTLDDVEELLDWGAKHLILGTAALERPQAVEKWVERYGGETFILSLDLRNGKLQTDGWLDESSRKVEDVIRHVVHWEMHEVICTDVDRDGTLEQPNWATFESLLELLPGGVSLLAAGGICAPEHISQLDEMGVDGVIIGRALYEGEYTWEELLSAG